MTKESGTPKADQGLHQDGRGVGGALAPDEKPTTPPAQQSQSSPPRPKIQGGFVDRLKGI